MGSICEGICVYVQTYKSDFNKILPSVFKRKSVPIMERKSQCWESKMIELTVWTNKAKSEISKNIKE